MSLPSLVLRLGVLSTLAAFATGCVVENERPRRLAPEPPYGAPEDVPPDDTSGGPVTTAPLLVEVDTDQTMTADPGQGVGVFIEYATGGKWHIWWTCDTLRTNKLCDVGLTITAGSGPIANVDTSELASGYYATPEPARLEASVRTTTEVHGIRFETLAGAVITVEANISGLRDGSFLFFVQDNKVRGGYAGEITNPLQLQGKTP